MGTRVAQHTGSLTARQGGILRQGPTSIKTDRHSVQPWNSYVSEYFFSTSLASSGRSRAVSSKELVIWMTAFRTNDGGGHHPLSSRPPRLPALPKKQQIAAVDSMRRPRAVPKKARWLRPIFIRLRHSLGVKGNLALWSRRLVAVVALVDP